MSHFCRRFKTNENKFLTNHYFLFGITEIVCERTWSLLAIIITYVL